MSAPLSTYKLIYFNLRVLGDPIKLLFNYAGVPFEDVRIDCDNEWPAMKNSTGWGKLPILVIDGKEELSQSIAIAKYLARKYNLDGANELESAKCDEYAGVAMDLRQAWRRYWFEKEEDKKEENKQEFLSMVVPSYFSKFSKILEENGGKYLVGEGLTWADLFLVVFLELFEDTVDKQLLQPYPTLQEYKENIHSIPQIKTFIENRLSYKF